MQRAPSSAPKSPPDQARNTTLNVAVLAVSSSLCTRVLIILALATLALCVALAPAAVLILTGTSTLIAEPPAVLRVPEAGRTTQCQGGCHWSRLATGTSGIRSRRDSRQTAATTRPSPIRQTVALQWQSATCAPTARMPVRRPLLRLAATRCVRSKPQDTGSPHATRQSLG